MAAAYATPFENIQPAAEADANALAQVMANSYGRNVTYGFDRITKLPRYYVNDAASCERHCGSHVTVVPEIPTKKQPQRIQ